jgi:acetylornithine deacetylase
VEEEQRVLQAVDRLWDEELEFLRGLVRRPSVRGETNLVQTFIAEWERAHGLDVQRVGVDVGRLHDLPGFSPVDWSYDGLFNVVGRANGAGGGRSLVLNGHVDVVSAEPAGHWAHDPWGAEITDGRMYGRGAGDMKAGIASALYALHAVRSAGVRLRGDVLVQTVIDEECSGNGTLACLDAGHVGDAAIVVEPTGHALTAAIPGVLWCRLHVTGQAAHARQASAAVNAIDKAYALVTALRRLEDEWNRPPRVHPALRELTHPINFNLGTIHAGDWASTVPEVCDVEVRIGFNPGEEIPDVQRAVRAAIDAACAEDPWLGATPPQVSFVGFHADGAVYDLDTDIAATLGRRHAALTGGEEPARRPMAATIDNRFFELYYGIPNVCYGPVADQLHAPDEWVDLASVRRVTEVLATTLVEWCGVEA